MNAAFSHSQAGGGGSIYASQSDTTLNQSTITDSTAIGADGGGAIRVTGGVLKVLPKNHVSDVPHV